MPVYSVSRRAAPPPQADKVRWNSPYWSRVRPLSVSRFHPRSTRHHPRVEAKLVHTSNAIHILFQVKDRFVLCEKTEMHTFVCQDSCVEAFLQPRTDKGYFNFEINCGATLLLFYVLDASKIGPKDSGYTRIKPDEAARLEITTSLQEAKPFRITGPLTWTLGYSVPVDLLESYAGPIGPLEGQWWRGNFFKCADYSKYPHWASWSPVGAPLRFHQPRRYGDLHFRAVIEDESGAPIGNQVPSISRESCLA
jgi:hypothetical protein